MSVTNNIFWYNGKLIQSQTLELDINDPGLLYGATVFTTLRVYDNSLDHNLTNWQAHCDRLLFSLQSFGWQHPDWKRVRQGVELILAHFPVLRITIFPDGREWIIGRFLSCQNQHRAAGQHKFHSPKPYRILLAQFFA